MIGHIVLILILVEDSRRQGKTVELTKQEAVLILILVEDSRRPEKDKRQAHEFGLNPYSSGR